MRQMPLDYYRSTGSGRIGSPGAAVAGCLVAVAILGCGSAGPYLEHILKFPPSKDWGLLIAFAGLEAVSVVSLWVMRKRDFPTAWKSFCLGLLLGTAIAALTEGVCFMVSSG